MNVSTSLPRLFGTSKFVPTVPISRYDHRIGSSLIIPSSADLRNISQKFGG